MSAKELRDLIGSILIDGDGFLEGVQARSESFPNLVAAVSEWGRLLGRNLDEIVAGVEPSIRQSILMTLLPAEALEAGFSGSYENAIKKHLENIGISLPIEGIGVLQDVIINLRKLQGMTSKEARNATKSLAQIRGRPSVYKILIDRQSGRCKWCGADLSHVHVQETLEHLVPKHIGNDMDDGSNWGISCATCNQGKGDAFAWSTTPWAHDYLERNDFRLSNIIQRRHRWVVLRRSLRCDSCTKGPTAAELFVYKRIPTGLPIPSNCAVTCANCAKKRGLIILNVDWAAHEIGREIP